MARNELESHLNNLKTFREAGLNNELEDFDLYIKDLSTYLPNDNEALLRFSLTLGEVARRLIIIPEYRSLGIFYMTLGSLATLQANENGTDINLYGGMSCNGRLRMGDITIPRNTFVTIEQSVEISKYLKSHGFSVGLVHGHFRLLTPSSIVFLIRAHELTDAVLVGKESADRTVRFKDVQPILGDVMQAEMFRTLMPFPFKIDDTIPYSDTGYRELVARINPNLYIGQSGNTESVREEMWKRAQLCGCDYREIESVPGLSTTTFIEKLNRVREIMGSAPLYSGDVSGFF